MKINWMWVLAIALLAVMVYATNEFGKPTQTYNCTFADNGSYNCVLIAGGSQ